MNKKVAISLLERQRVRLNASGLDEQQWLNQTASLVDELFGRTSVEYIFISKFRFYVFTNGIESPESVMRRVNNTYLDANRFIDNCIERVQERGVPALNGNLLTRLSDTAIWTIFGFLLTIPAGLGMYFGGHFAERRNDDLRLEIKALRDSLLLLRPTTNQVPDPRADTVGKKNIEDKK